MNLTTFLERLSHESEHWGDPTIGEVDVEDVVDALIGVAQAASQLNGHHGECQSLDNFFRLRCDCGYTKTREALAVLTAIAEKVNA